MSNLTDQRSSDFYYKQVLLESERLDKSLGLRDITTDIDIFEHLDKPYLTGTITIVDTSNILAQADILGGETINIAIVSTREESKTVSKRFYISNIITSQNSSENNSTHIFHLIEDIAYFSNLENVNRSYTGSGHTIIQKIAKNYLGKEVLLGYTAPKQSMKLIVPNLNPIEAMTWIKNQLTTVDGYPLYLFSALFSEELFLVDLGSLLSEPVINAKLPYIYNQGTTRSNDPDVKRRVIYSYEQKNTENLFALIQKGLIGAQYHHIDVLKNVKNSFKYDITDDLLKKLILSNVAQANQPNVLYSSDYKFNEIPFNQYTSRNIAQIGGINSYRESDDEVKHLSLGENRYTSDYKLRVISNSMDKLLKKAPMVVNLPGIDFISNKTHMTVGSQLRMQFPISMPNTDQDVPKIDTKKSGDYLIFGARHKFKLEKYDLTLSCLKLANYRSVK